MEWLRTLSPIVAVVVLFVYAMKHDKQSSLDTIETLSKCFVEPLQKGIQEGLATLSNTIGNHLKHDLETRIEDRTERKEMRKAIEALTDQIKANGRS